jgi:hypothetical protein
MLLAAFIAVEAILNLKFSKYYTNNLQKEIALNLGVTSTEFKDLNQTPKFVRAMTKRYSAELTKNRLSDVCGDILNFWSWLSLIAPTLILIGVIWYTVTEGVDRAVFAWSAVGASAFFCASSIFFAFSCWLITGRLPGEARRARKVLSEALNI